MSTSRSAGQPVTATAAVLRDAAGQYMLEDVVLEPPGPSDVVVRIAGSGLCHSDLLPRTPVADTPIITGHEGAGIVETVGANVETLTVGDHVVLSFDSCGGCENCLAVQPAYCDTFWPRNLTGRRPDRTTNATDSGGAPISARWFGQSSFATRTVVTAPNAVKVDSSLPIELLGPLGCGVLTGAGAVLNALDVRPGSAVAVFGAGAVGLSAIMAAHLAGATDIIAVDINPTRLELAAELGATETLDGNRDGVLARLKKLSDGGVRYSLDTTGVSTVLSTALDTVRPGGTLGVLGTPRGDWTLKAHQLSNGVTINGILEGDSAPQLFIPTLITLWRQGRFPFDKLITTFPLEEINDAERAMRNGDVVKPVLLPGSAEERS